MPATRPSRSDAACAGTSGAKGGVDGAGGGGGDEGGDVDTREAGGGEGGGEDDDDVIARGSEERRASAPEPAGSCGAGRIGTTGSEPLRGIERASAPESRGAARTGRAGGCTFRSSVPRGGWGVGRGDKGGEMSVRGVAAVDGLALQPSVLSESASLVLVLRGDSSPSAFLDPKAIAAAADEYSIATMSARMASASASGWEEDAANTAVSSSSSHSAMV